MLMMLVYDSNRRLINAATAATRQNSKEEESVTDVLPQLPIFGGLDHTPTDEELVSATNKLKNKAPGTSGLCSQLWKSMLDSLESFFNPASCTNRLLGKGKQP